MKNGRKAFVAVLSASQDEESMARSLVQAVARRYGQQADIVLSDWPLLLPHFDPQAGVHDLPVAVGMFREEVEGCQALLICTPEHAFGAPAAITNAVEWLLNTTLLDGKPVALIVAPTRSGRRFEDLLGTLQSIGAVLPDGGTACVSENGDASEALKMAYGVVEALLRAVTQDPEADTR